MSDASQTPARAQETCNFAQLSDNEWKARLTPEQFEITRHKGTEPAFSGEYHDCKQAGIYACRCCGTPLFTSEQKYDSGSGWPSFWQPLSETAVGEETDNAYGMLRTEVICNQCHAHLGHVFEDGPQPTGLRYCINSASIQLKPKP